MYIRIGDMLQAELMGWVEVVEISSDGSFCAENWTGIKTYYSKEGNAASGDKIVAWELGTEPIGQVTPSDGLVGGAKHREEWHAAHGVQEEERC